jgi:hypothetical protein
MWLKKFAAALLYSAACAFAFSYLSKQFFTWAFAWKPQRIWEQRAYHCVCDKHHFLILG